MSDFSSSDFVCIQDPTHLGATWRCRLGKLDKFMPLGNKIASVAHVTEIMAKVGKDLHGLREGDILFEDKMNYDAVRRLSNPKLRSLLKQVPGAEGTIFYLKLMDFLTNSFIDKKLDPPTKCGFQYLVFVAGDIGCLVIVPTP